MEKDVAPGIIEKVNRDFESKIDSSAIHALEEKAANGAATYEDAYKYAEKIGEARSKALQTHVTTETLPEGKIYYNIADRLMNDSLSTDHEMVAEYAAKAQQAINEKAGIKLKAQKAELEQDRIDSFINGLCGSEGNLIEDVLWKLGEPVVTHARTVVDSTIKKNAEFQHKAGLKATITRKAAPRCCDWCTDLEGDYTYPNVPREVFQRHDHCKCTVDYDGKKLTAYNSGSNAHTFRDQSYSARRDERKILDEIKLKTLTDRDIVKTRIERAKTDLIKREFARQLDTHPEMLGNYTPESLKETLTRAGYEVKALSKGNYKGISFEDGGGYKVNFGGNGLLSYHPEERSHHDGPYYKISNSVQGLRRYDLSGKEIIE